RLMLAAGDELVLFGLVGLEAAGVLARDARDRGRLAGNTIVVVTIIVVVVILDDRGGPRRDEHRLGLAAGSAATLDQPHRLLDGSGLHRLVVVVVVEVDDRARQRARQRVEARLRSTHRHGLVLGLATLDLFGDSATRRFFLLDPQSRGLELAALSVFFGIDRLGVGERVVVVGIDDRRQPVVEGGERIERRSELEIAAARARRLTGIRAMDAETQAEPQRTDRLRLRIVAVATLERLEATGDVPE